MSQNKSPKRQRTRSSNGNSPSEETFKVIILVGGPSKGTRFRPLSLGGGQGVPKPLFPIAGQPLIWHHLKACTKLSGLLEVLILGFYSNDEAKELQEFISHSEKEFGIKIRYLMEQTQIGTAGGLNYFKDDILSGNPAHFFVLHCDIACAFPLQEILTFHKQHGKEGSILVKRLPKNEVQAYGCVAVDPQTHEMLHYVEKPETFVSDFINCGVYLFSPSIFTLMQQASESKMADENSQYLQLEQDLFMKMSGEKHFYVYETKDFWNQLKSAGSLLPASANLLSQASKTNPDLLAKTGDKTAQIIGHVLIHPSAKVHPTAKLGPNVAIGEGVVIGPGVRILHSIVLARAEIKAHACILHSIVGWDSVVGEWTRLEGVPDYSGPATDLKSCGVTILGSGVKVAPEIVIRSCIVLPHKELTSNYNDQILM